MKCLLLIVCSVFLLFVSFTARPFPGPKDGPPVRARILLFTKTAGYHHTSIPAGVRAIMALGREHGFAVDTSSDASRFRADKLSHYSAVVFLNTTGALLDAWQQADFERYIQSGGGFVGVHAAADAEYDWRWYGRLVGAYFDSHPEQQEAVLNVVDNTDKATSFLPAHWKRFDEWYNFKRLDPNVHVLLSIDEHSYKGGKNGDVHPMAWYHAFDGGRSWYTELGHTDESYADPLFLKHLLGGIEYAIGGNRPLDHSKARSARPPEEYTFTKTPLAMGKFLEPTEMTILPNLDILVAQRRGEFLLYKAATGKIKHAGALNVYWKTLHTPKVNAEDGLLGVQADPNFSKNHFVYVYYSPVDTSVNRLSRFTFDHDSVEPGSERTILEVGTQREICCHTGGSIAFSDDHTLFVSTGDNSTPFDEGNTPYPSHGFAPLDDRPGHRQYDARRSAGNSNDLRGKILRITVNADGSYSIPKGNLFAGGQTGTRPEIYVMGNRNPYRISVDRKSGFLYWGDVGPDANDDSLDTRGPKGYDEVGQARTAGFFGWPYFVADNYAYHRHDYATNVNGPAYDPADPVNDSRNNTGIEHLPPAQPAFIWYPYAASPDFPEVGSGGRCAMAGPVFHADAYPARTRMPVYFDGKLFIYDFTRSWFKVVSLQPNGDFDKLEAFMGHTRFSSPIDVEMGPDGRLYILEYGSGWFVQNKDAGLSRIDYHPDALPPAPVVKPAPTTGAKPVSKVSARLEAGKNLVFSLDCKTCHKTDDKSIGPAFNLVAERYKNDASMVAYLEQKIRNGGSGKWSDVVMPAHPALKDEELQLIIGWIKSLAAPAAKGSKAAKK